MSFPHLSIVICTYNRSFILRDCIDSLLPQLIHPQLLELIIVDNASTDDTKELVDSYLPNHPKIRYVLEPVAGLSFARNRGYLEGKAAWICYLDDDAKIAENYVVRALWVIENYAFDCFGGVYRSWFKYGRPRWMDEKFGTSSIDQQEVGILEKDYLWGGNLLVRRDVLKAIGGFDTDLGMSENKIAYGEDDFLQIQLRERQSDIGFDPKLIIYHAVLPHKLQLSWHLKSYFASSRDQQKIKQDSLSKILFLLLRSSLSALFRKIPVALFKFIFYKKYYWEHFILDTTLPLAFRCGQLQGYFIWLRS